MNFKNFGSFFKVSDQTRADMLRTIEEKKAGVVVTSVAVAGTYIFMAAAQAILNLSQDDVPEIAELISEDTEM